MRVYPKLRRVRKQRVEKYRALAADIAGEEFAFHRTEGAIVEYESIRTDILGASISPRAPNLATTRNG